MPVDWAPDTGGIYHALAHYSDSGNEPWTTLCGMELAPSPNQLIEAEEPPTPSHRKCAELAKQTGGLGPRDVQRMVESGEAGTPERDETERVAYEFLRSGIVASRVFVPSAPHRATHESAAKRTAKPRGKRQDRS